MPVVDVAVEDHRCRRRHCCRHHRCPRRHRHHLQFLACLVALELALELALEASGLLGTKVEIRPDPRRLGGLPPPPPPRLFSSGAKESCMRVQKLLEVC
jgi:hypothetical protein